MSNKKKILLNFLWFLVGMAAIAAIPLLLIEKCSEAKKPEIRGNQGQRQGSIDHSNETQVICRNLTMTCRAV